MKIYLISGESYLLINEQINNIIKDSKNITIFDLSVNTIEEAVLEAGYFSMFDEKKYIIIKNANFFGTEKIKEKDNELLLNYFESPNVNSVLIFVCNTKLDTRKKITKVIKEKYSIINVPNLKYYEIENKVIEICKKKGFAIESETAKYIVACSLNNYDIAITELNKVFLYYNEPCHILKEDVNHIISKPMNTNNFLFVDAIVENDLERSLELFNDLKIMKVEPTILLSLIARDFRIMLQVKTMLEEGKREYTIMNEIGLLDWQLEKYLNKVFPYKLKELESILIKLANIDLEIKTGKKEKYMALELFILDICG